MALTWYMDRIGWPTNASWLAAAEPSALASARIFWPYVHTVAEGSVGQSPYLRFWWECMLNFGLSCFEMHLNLLSINTSAILQF